MHVFQKRRWTARCRCGRPGACVWGRALGVDCAIAPVISCWNPPTVARRAPSWKNKRSARRTTASHISDAGHTAGIDTSTLSTRRAEFNLMPMLNHCRRMRESRLAGRPVSCIGSSPHWKRTARILLIETLITGAVLAVISVYLCIIAHYFANIDLWNRWLAVAQPLFFNITTWINISLPLDLTTVATFLK